MENQKFPCTEVGFTCKDFQAGYLPDSTEVVIQGLLSITATVDFPYSPFTFDVESHCGELKFPNGQGIYNQPIYAVTVYRGQTSYIPFALTLTTCGKNECTVSYEFEIETEEGSFTCSGEANVHSYNATCEWQECLVGTSRNTVDPVFCNPETDCSQDLCELPDLQRLAVMVALDKTIAYKIEQKQWSQVDALFEKGLGICDCVEKPNPCLDCDEEKHKDKQNIVDNG